MRLIASIIEITGELERINDYSKGIAKNSLLIGSMSIPDVIGHMPEMARKTQEMLQRALEDLGNSCVIARDADDADRVLADLEVEAVTLDLGMPGRGGRSRSFERPPRAQVTRAQV